MKSFFPLKVLRGGGRGRGLDFFSPCQNKEDV